jgi:hypothetical protein
VISETGLCVWRSGPRPALEVKTGGEFLRGRMSVFWTGGDHDTPRCGINIHDAIIMTQCIQSFGVKLAIQNFLLSVSKMSGTG